MWVRAPPLLPLQRTLIAEYHSNKVQDTSMHDATRLPYDAVTEAEVYQYFKTRHLQLMQYDYHWEHTLTPVPGGYTTKYSHTLSSTAYSSFFVTADNRGKGYASSIVRDLPHQILTVNDCQVVEFITKCGRTPMVVSGTFDSTEYKLIEQFYGSRTTRRSGVFLMNHIDEGLWILERIKASSEAKRAYCLHPLLQTDADVASNLRRVATACDPYVVALAMEYRNQANAWLSDKVVRIRDRATDYLTTNGHPTCGPIAEVRDMLVADKIQNYKDFCLHHMSTHERAQELDAYFHEWFTALGVDNVNEWVDNLSYCAAGVQLNTI